MEEHQNKTRTEIGKIFNYDPSSLEEELSCTLGPILGLVGLGRFAPNVSEKLSKEEIRKRIGQQGLATSVDEVIDAGKYSIFEGKVRKVIENDDGSYLCASYFFD
ncbi:hypothetical protein KAI32_00675 [Candidatus Pacearchaeota archaeon]|nr:hypothetical protein [Candidatus Pacearchaeota archaeon]